LSSRLGENVHQVGGFVVGGCVLPAVVVVSLDEAEKDLVGVERGFVGGDVVGVEAERLEDALHRVGGGGGGGRVFSALEELGRVLGHLERLGRVVLGVGWERVGRGIARVGSRVVVAEGAVRCELAALGVFAARGRFVIQLVGKRLFMENG